MHAKIEEVPKVTFLNIDGKGADKTVEFEHGKLPYDGHGKPESLLDVAMNFHLHLEHACGGSCACTTCHVWVKEGLNNVNEPEEDELDRVELAPDLRPNSRLGCQMVITGDVVWKFRRGIATTSAKAAARSIWATASRSRSSSPIRKRPERQTSVHHARGSYRAIKPFFNADLINCSTNSCFTCAVNLTAFAVCLTSTAS